MRIGLVTWIGRGNFGTTLQSFALCRKLQMMGHDVYFPMQCIPSNPIKELVKKCYISLDMTNLEGNMNMRCQIRIMA